MTHTLAIQMLGGVSIAVNGRIVTTLVSRKAEALLIFLACNPRPHPRDSLATMLWTDQSQQRALANLSVVLSNLRKEVGDFFHATRQDISFDPPPSLLLDVRELEEGVTAVAHATTPHIGREEARQLAHAISHYRGDFLAGFHLRGAEAFEDWARLQRERYHHLATAALSHLVDYFRQRQHFHEGIQYAVQLVGLDPLREEAHRQLMTLYAQSGQQTLALEQYETCLRLLDEELGVSPEPETEALAEAIRDERALPSNPRTPTDTAVTQRHNLPAQTTALVGRTLELGHIQTRINDPACRLLTLIGPGGVGKTRLLLAAAWAQVGEFLDGVWFVPLASLERADLLETAVADAIGFDFAGQDAPRTQLLSYLRSKEMLLVLDNFEHLLAEAATSLLVDILTQASRVQIMVSSRSRLQLQPEWLLEIGGLPLTAADSPAIQLFAHRARQVRPAFEAAANMAAMHQICQAVGGLPLAIELAAASVRHYTCAQIAQSLHENLDFLAASQRDVPERHRSMRAVFNHSWRLLSGEAQQAFAALSVFSGTFTSDAALAVWKRSLAVLHDLADQSLLQLGENGRWQMHDILRQYAREALEADPAAAAKARDRHGAYYANFLRQQRPLLLGGGQVRALEAITAEIENVRSGWHYARTLDRQTPTLLSLLHEAADALFWFFYQRSRFREGVVMLQEAVMWLTPPRNPAERLLLARMNARCGWLAYLLGDVEHGRNALTHALSVFEEMASLVDVVFCLNYLGAIALFSEAGDQAERLLLRSLQMAREQGDRLGESIALNMLGVLTMRQGQLDAAVERLQQSLAIKRDNGDLWGMAFSLEFLGAVLVRRQQLPAAADRYAESLLIREELGDRRGVALCLRRLGDLASQVGDRETAVSRYTECLAILADIGLEPAAVAVQAKLAALAAPD